MIFDWNKPVNDRKNQIQTLFPLLLASIIILGADQNTWAVITPTSLPKIERTQTQTESKLDVPPTKVQPKTRTLPQLELKRDQTGTSKDIIKNTPESNEIDRHLGKLQNFAQTRAAASILNRFAAFHKEDQWRRDYVLALENSETILETFQSKLHKTSFADQIITLQNSISDLASLLGYQGKNKNFFFDHKERALLHFKIGELHRLLSQRSNFRTFNRDRAVFHFKKALSLQGSSGPTEKIREYLVDLYLQYSPSERQLQVDLAREISLPSIRTNAALATIKTVQSTIQTLPQIQKQFLSPTKPVLTSGSNCN